MQCRNGSYNKVIVKDLWMLDRVAKGKSINLARYIMDKIFLTLRQKISCAKKMLSTHKKIIVPICYIDHKDG